MLVKAHVQRVNSEHLLLRICWKWVLMVTCITLQRSTAGWHTVCSYNVLLYSMIALKYEIQCISNTKCVCCILNTYPKYISTLFGGRSSSCPFPVSYPPSVWPHMFHGDGHEKRSGEQLKWSQSFTLYIESFPCAQLPVHTARLGRVFLYIFSLGLCFACLFVLFDLFVCAHSFMFAIGRWSGL